MIDDLFLIIGATVGIATAGFIIWNSSKKVTTLEIEIKTQRQKFEAELEEQEEKFTQEINDLKENRHKLVVEYNDKLSVNVRDLEKKVLDAKVERRDEISKAAADQKEDLVQTQKQLEMLKGDIKDVAARVIIVDTKIGHHDIDIAELKECDKDTKKFFADWVQRVEDRIENLRREILQFYRESEKKSDNLQERN